MTDHIIPYLVRTIRLQRDNPRLGLLQYRNLLTAGRYAALFDLSPKYLAEQDRVLDWGCGNGHFSYFLAKRGLKPHIFSLDDPPPLLSLLRREEYEFAKGNKSDPVTLPYPNDFFGGVVSVGVLEHVREFGGSEAASLREIFRILKPGGLFIGTHIPNSWSWIEFLASFFPRKHHHRWRYSRTQLRGFLERAGFEILELRSYGIFPRWLMGRCPDILANSIGLAASFNALDHLLERVFPLFCTHHLAVARKPMGRPTLESTRLDL